MPAGTLTAQRNTHTPVHSTNTRSAIHAEGAAL